MSGVHWFGRDSSSPVLTLEVAFENDANATSPTWTDISSYMQDEITVSRGKQTELDATEPGAFSVTLDNTDRRFDPFYTSSPYYPYVEPMKQVRLRATYNSTTYDVWR